MSVQETSREKICPSCLRVGSKDICEDCGMLREEQCEYCNQPKSQDVCIELAQSNDIR